MSNEPTAALRLNDDDFAPVSASDREGLVVMRESVN